MTVLCPGPVPTEFQARAGMSGEIFPPLLTRPAERVARDGYRGLKEGRVLVVPGSANQVVKALIGVMPRSLLLQISDLHRRARQR